MENTEQEKMPKVMIIDDDKFLLDMYAVKFKKSGVVVDACLTAEDALKKIRDGARLDVLLVDIVMPGMDGFRFINTLREENLVPSASVLILSNQGQAVDIEKAKSLNVDGYIIKATTIPSEVVEKTMAAFKEKTKNNREK